MKATFPDTLLQLFREVIEHPESMLTVLVDDWPEDAVERRLLVGFHEMLEGIQQKLQNALNGEEQYRSLYEATIDALTILDLDGFIVEANSSACRMYGYSYKELLSMKGADIVSPQSLATVLEAIQTIMKGDNLQTLLRTDCIRKDGSLLVTEGHATLFMYKGKPHILTVARDITEQVQAEQQLREKEAEYRSVFEAGTDGLVINDLEDGHLVEVNPAMCRMHGYTYEEFMALHPMNFILPASHALFAEYLDVVKAGRSWQGRAIDIRKDETSFPVEVHGTTFIYKGKPHVLAAVRDITERVQAEEQLREKEEQYRSIFEATTDALFIIGMEDTCVVEVNPAACTMYGYAYQEFIGLPLSTIIHPDNYLFFMTDVLPRIKAGGEDQGRRVLNLRKDGTPFPIDVHQTAFTYQGKLHLLAVVRDITEQVQAEQELREKEAEYRSVFEATTDGLAISDMEDGHTVEVNPAMCRMYGYTYEEFIAVPPAGTLHPDSYHLVAESLQAIKTSGEFYSRPIVLHKNGTPFHIESHARTFMYKGKPHILSVVRDITEQVQAQQLLEQRVKERTRELSTLLEISHNVASTIELRPLLGLVLDQLKVVADYTGSSFSLVEGEDFVLVENRGPAPLEKALQVHLPIPRMGLIWEMFCRREPVIISDVRDDTPLAHTFRAWMDGRENTTFSYIRAWMGVPLTHKEQVIGMLTLSSYEPNYYTPQHAALTLAIANQAAVALENARLYEQAQELAALEERQRLARELHDSVSQALYGITLGTHTARTLLDRDPSKVAEPLDYVLSQAETALKEMRALIFELRPDSLESDGLIAALTRQGAALRARYGIEVSTEFCDEPDIPLKVKQELYRIVQEALHNTFKHAHANEVVVRMEYSMDGLMLEVCDDGIGFDTAHSFPGHLGLHSMRERVLRLGGIIQIESTQGQGTRIRTQLPAYVRH